MPKQQNNPDPNQLLTIEQLAASLNVSRRFILSEQAQGRINPIRLGRKCVRYSVAERDRYIAASQTQGPV